ncbi:MAG: hypothetical protein P8176_15885 [Gammaproteobacteria bacterium]
MAEKYIQIELSQMEKEAILEYADFSVTDEKQKMILIGKVKTGSVFR